MKKLGMLLAFALMLGAAQFAGPEGQAREAGFG